MNNENKNFVDMIRKQVGYFLWSYCDEIRNWFEFLVFSVIVCIIGEILEILPLGLLSGNSMIAFLIFFENAVSAIFYAQFRRRIRLWLDVDGEYGGLDWVQLLWGCFDLLFLGVFIWYVYKSYRIAMGLVWIEPHFSR